MERQLSQALIPPCFWRAADAELSSGAGTPLLGRPGRKGVARTCPCPCACACPGGIRPAPEQHLGPRRGRLLPRSALWWPRAGGGEGPAGAGAEALLTKQNGGNLLFQALDGSEKGKN